MAEGRDLSHEAYQPPWIQKYGPMVGGATLLILLVLWIMFAKPFEDKGRGATALVPAEPVRLSTKPNIAMIQDRPTQRIAIHGAGVYITWADSRTSPPSVVLASSSDTGKTFTEHVIGAPAGGRLVRNPMVACDSSGSVYLLYSYERTPEGADIGEQVSRVARSDDAGAHWSQIRNIQTANGTSLKDAVMGFDGHDILHVAALTRMKGADQVVVTRSANRAESFEPESVVSQAPSGIRRDLAIAVTPAGKVAVVWCDLRDAPDVPENGVIYGSLAMNGQDFAPEQLLIKPKLRPGRQRYPSALFDDSGHLGILFTESMESDKRDSFVLRYAWSDSNGQTFAEPVTLFGKELLNPSSPVMAAGSEGHWYLTAQGTMTDYGQPTAVIAQSTDAGKRWQALTPVVDRFSAYLKYPGLAVQENTAIVTYFDYADPEGKPGTSEAYAVRLEDKAVKP